MEREKFMQEARLTAHKILEGKENGIMNLVQQAWAEGKRNAEVETLRAAIDEALDKREPKAEPVEDEVYPTWGEWLESEAICFSRLKNYSRVAGVSIPQVFEFQIDGETAFICGDKVNSPIPADIAVKLGIEPKEG